jgi:uncharacterized lipoprotein
VKKITVIALAMFVLAGCSSADKEARQQQQFLHDESSLATSQHNATVTCEAAQCDAAWEATKRYIAKNSDTAITRADADAIETEVPYSSGKTSLSATRVKSGNGATLTLFAQCRGMYGADKAKGSDYDECADKIIKTQNAYVTWLRAHPSGQ